MSNIQKNLIRTFLAFACFLFIVFIITGIKKYSRIFRYGSYICHQQPGRSFFINNSQVFLCSRCAGIYLSFFVCVLFFSFTHFTLSYKILFILLSIAITCNLITSSKFIDSNNLRFLSGLLFGFNSGFILIKSTKILFNNGDTYGC